MTIVALTLLINLKNNINMAKTRKLSSFSLQIELTKFDKQGLKTLSEWLKEQQFIDQMNQVDEYRLEKFDEDFENDKN